MISVRLYTRKDCHLCEQAKNLLRGMQKDVPHDLEEVDIDSNRHYRDAYGYEIPVVEIGPYTVKSPFSEQELLLTLRAAADREQQIKDLDDAGVQSMVQQGKVVTRADRFSYWLSRHYLVLINAIVLLYFGIPFLAPVFMVNGWERPGRLIYSAYGLVCHQFAFRSWFLFGEQAAYPLEDAGIEGLNSYEQSTGLDRDDIWAARQFVGNLELGYKVAFCERDIAIYGGIFLFGLIFSLTGRRLKSLPWYFWVLIGIVPIAADGLSQLLSQPPMDLIIPDGWLAYRESTPFLRTLTGGLFGFTTAWFGIPMVEDTMADTKKYIAWKISQLEKGAE
ncbi:MAG: DUF2085 domain-containing protein [Anaerolineales bacterium]|nr:DUF2085 domain-containing protein [Anaerolineales bacterium]